MTQPTITVSLGRLTGWTLGTVGKSELGTTTTLATYTYTPITSRVIDFSIRRGRQHELDRIETGTASLTLLNQDGAFTPSNTSSVYYPDIRPMVPIKIQATLAELPETITGLVAWYDFSDATTLFTDTARTTPVASDGDIIKGVTDKSGNAHHLTEATNGPTYKVAILNGHSITRFDGTNDILANTSMTADASQTMLLVAQKRSAPSGSSRTVFSVGAGTNAQAYTNSGTHATQWLWFTFAGGSPYGGTATSLTGLVYRVNSAASMDAYYSGGTPANCNPDDLVTTGTTISFGANNDGTNFGDYDIGEALIYNSALAASDLNILGPYLASKWGFTWTMAT